MALLYVCIASQPCLLCSLAYAAFGGPKAGQTATTLRLLTHEPHALARGLTCMSCPTRRDRHSAILAFQSISASAISEVDNAATAPRHTVPPFHFTANHLALRHPLCIQTSSITASAESFKPSFHHLCFVISSHRQCHTQLHHLPL